MRGADLRFTRDLLPKQRVENTRKDMHVYRDRAQIPICRVDMFMAHEDLHNEERVDRLTLLLKTFEPGQQPASECRPQQMRSGLEAAGNACTTNDMLIGVLANRQASAG